MRFERPSGTPGPRAGPRKSCCGRLRNVPRLSAPHLSLALPDTVDRKHCALFGVACVALRAVRRMGVSGGDNVWVVGQGPIGNFVGQAARAMGAQVTVTDLVAKRLEVAQICGAH